MDDTPATGEPATPPRADANPDQPAKTRHGRRMQRIREEIERNRTEGPTIPTWALVLALVLIVGAVVLLVMIS